MIWRNVFLVGETPVLVEQLRLLLGNISKSAPPRLPLVALLLWSLLAESNGQALWLWAIAIIASKLCQVIHARRVLAAGISPQQTGRVIAALLVLQAIDGSIWGWLPWLALDMASVTKALLIFSILAVVTSNAMSLLSPLPPIFLAFGVCVGSFLSGKLSQMGDPTYDVLIIGTLLFIATLAVFARNGARMACASIDLRFENLELIGRLQVESEKALAAHREAEEANLAKSKFLAAASHDLRQPIHAQGLLLDVLDRTELSASQRDLVGHIRASTSAAGDMLNTLLDFSRVEAGVVRPAVKPFRLQPLLHRIEREFAPLAVSKNLVFRLRETHAAALSDPALIELILRNLVSNAIRYTERGGVLVACRAVGDGLRLEVWDTGIGIEPAQQQEVFREFHQLGNPERDRSKGLGLGLAIADRLARALGHRLWLVSTPGRGSVLRLELPLATGAVVADECDTMPRVALAPGLRVLVVDDDEAVRTAVTHLLTDWGCICTAVEFIDQALAATREQVPDIIISDYRLRGQQTGAEAIAALRSQCGQELPALLITGDTAPERLREAIAANVPLLHKPVSPALLHQALARLQTG